MKVPTPEARDAVLIFTRWQPCTMSVAVVEQAWHWMDRAQLSYWDALVLASARRLGCRWLLSEDFQAGRDFDGITVVNPFTDRPPHEAPHPA